MDKSEAELRETVTKPMGSQVQAGGSQDSSFHLHPKKVDLGPRLKETLLRVLRRAVTVAITKESSICKISPLRLLITPEALSLHF